MKDLTPEVSNHKLSDRKKMILRSVIESHINNGEPVGSKYLVSSANIPYSSATIRAEMAELEEMGYLEQPHTSSGRIPTQQGYRFYVDSLMESYKLTGTEIIELNNMLKSKIGELDSILASASKLVASLTNYTSVALKAGNKSDSVKNFSYMLLDSHEFLLVMKMEDGKVVTKQIKTDVELNDRILFKLEQQLNSKLVNLTSKEITLPIMMDVENAMGVESSIVSPAFRAIYETLGNDTESDLKYEGVTKLLDYRSAIGSADSDKLLRIFTDCKDYRDSFDTRAGSVQREFRIYLDLIDEAGSIATVATILAVNAISIKNVGIVHNREFEQGVLRIVFYEEDSMKKAIGLLGNRGYTIYHD